MCQYKLNSVESSSSRLSILNYLIQDHPGPGAYTPVLPPSILGAAKISEARPNSYLDWEVLRGQDIPGPAAYNIFLSG